MADVDQVRGDFDRIAALPDEPWDNNHRFHSMLLRRIPLSIVQSLDIGCGKGVFTRQLAERSRHVLAVDLSPIMIEQARRLSKESASIEFLVGDILAMDWPAEQFDVITSITTLHHLRLEDLLPRIRRWLRPGGTFLALDLVADDAWIDRMKSRCLQVANIMERRVRTGLWRMPLEHRKAWEAHARTDKYLTMSEAREQYSRLLPGCEVRRHRFWRYSCLWRKG